MWDFLCGVFSRQPSVDAVCFLSVTFHCSLICSGKRAGSTSSFLFISRLVSVEVDCSHDRTCCFQRLQRQTQLPRCCVLACVWVSVWSEVSERKDSYVEMKKGLQLPRDVQLVCACVCVSLFTDHLFTGRVSSLMWRRWHTDTHFDSVDFSIVTVDFVV